MLCPYIKSTSTFPKVILKHLHTLQFPVFGIFIQLLQWEQFQILFELKRLGENLIRTLYRNSVEKPIIAIYNNFQMKFQLLFNIRC